MFVCWLREEWKEVTVYAVDFEHDAFLISYKGEFRWKPKTDFKPIEEEEE